MPVLAALGAVPVLGEPIRFRLLVAGGLVLGGIALARGGPVAGDPGKPSPVGSWNQRSCLR